MFNGRHLLLLGFVACAGLLSVHDGQRQIELGYQIAAVEKQLRDVRAEIELCKIKHQALQSPRAVMTRAVELKLKVGPAAPEAPAGVERPPEPARPEPPRSLGSPQGARPPVPPLPSAPPRMDLRLPRHGNGR